MASHGGTTFVQIAEFQPNVESFKTYELIQWLGGTHCGSTQENGQIRICGDYKITINPKELFG